jgi:hypothetical protein
MPESDRLKFSPFSNSIKIFKVMPSIKASPKRKTEKLKYTDTGIIPITEANEMNIPVNLRIAPPKGTKGKKEYECTDSTKWELTACNFCPRLADDGRSGAGKYGIEADTKEDLLAVIQKHVVPLYETALNNIKTTGENYYWEAQES